MNKEFIEFLLKLRDSAFMMMDAANEYLETLTPKEVNDHVDEQIFNILKFESQKGTKLGDFEVANKTNNDIEKWQKAYDILNQAKASIQSRYHGQKYAFSYWLFSEGKIYRQKLKEKA